MLTSQQFAGEVAAVQRRGTVAVTAVVAVLLAARLLVGGSTGLPRSTWSGVLVVVVIGLLMVVAALVVADRTSPAVGQRSLLGILAPSVLLWQLDAALMLPRSLALDFQLTWSQNMTTLTIGAYLVLPRRVARRAVAAAGAAAGATMAVASRTIDGMPEVWQGTVGLLVVVALADALAGSVAVLRDHEARARAAAALAFADDLTGLPNRRGAHGALGRLGPGAAMALVDLDGFKLVNDRHGHDVGDAVLVAVGAALRLALRTGDVAVRWGGEEFLVLLDGAGGGHPAGLAERLRDAVAGSDAPVPVTASVGVAVVGDGEAWEDVFRRADQALYAAKDGGRDRVVVAPTGGPTGQEVVDAAG